MAEFRLNVAGAYFRRHFRRAKPRTPATPAAVVVTAPLLVPAAAAG
jgi:hypothetical protein